MRPPHTVELRCPCTHENTGCTRFAFDSLATVYAFRLRYSRCCRCRPHPCRATQRLPFRFVRALCVHLAYVVERLYYLFALPGTTWRLPFPSSLLSYALFSYHIYRFSTLLLNVVCRRHVFVSVPPSYAFAVGAAAAFTTYVSGCVGVYHCGLRRHWLLR